MDQLLLADDHAMIRSSLKLMCTTLSEFTQVHEVGSCNELLKELSRREYSHLILDLVLSDGTALDVLPDITCQYRNLKIMVFSMQPKEIYAEVLKQYGVFHYLSKDAQVSDTIMVLKQFLHNELSIPADSMIQHPANPFSKLSRRELEVLTYWLKGEGNKEITRTLEVKPSTISTYKLRILEKTRTSNLKELADLAVAYKLKF